MICKFCGNVVDETAAMCPYCGNSLQDDTFFEDDEEEVVSSAPSKKPSILGGIKKPEVSFSGKGLSSILSFTSLIAAVLSLICLFMITGLKSTITSTNNALIQQVNILTGTVSTMESSMANLETAVSNVQSEAYNQLASQTISITKDLTSLTGPVTKGKTNVMFIIRAKGSLNVNTSFDWQKYNTTTGGWVSIVFTGVGVNDEYGLRIYNSKDASTDEVYSELWAEGITEAAAGSYRCVITDTAGIQKSSSEVTVSIDAG